MRNGLITYSDGYQRWYKDDKLHREDDLPAIIYTSGTQIWLIDNKVHRENGPATMYIGGEIRWWLNDKKYTFDDWCLKLGKSPKEKAYLALKYL